MMGARMPLTMRLTLYEKFRDAAPPPHSPRVQCSIMADVQCSSWSHPQPSRPAMYRTRDPSGNDAVSGRYEYTAQGDLGGF